MSNRSLECALQLMLEDVPSEQIAEALVNVLGVDKATQVWNYLEGKLPIAVLNCIDRSWFDERCDIEEIEFTGSDEVFNYWLHRFASRVEDDYSSVSMDEFIEELKSEGLIKNREERANV